MYFYRGGDIGGAGRLEPTTFQGGGVEPPRTLSVLHHPLPSHPRKETTKPDRLDTY